MYAHFHDQYLSEVSNPTILMQLYTENLIITRDTENM